LALYFSTGLMVAKARQKFGVVLPATTGHTDFERVFPRAAEYAGMDADLLAGAVAVCALRRRCLGGGRWGSSGSSDG